MSALQHEPRKRIVALEMMDRLYDLTTTMVMMAFHSFQSSAMPDEPSSSTTRKPNNNKRAYSHNNNKHRYSASTSANAPGAGYKRQHQTDSSPSDLAGLKGKSAILVITHRGKEKQGARQILSLLEEELLTTDAAASASSNKSISEQISANVNQGAF